MFWFITLIFSVQETGLPSSLNHLGMVGCGMVCPCGIGAA